jgi:hypothetical protein
MSVREIEARKSRTAAAIKKRLGPSNSLTMWERLTWSEPPFWKPEDKALPVREQGETWREAYNYEKRHGTWKERNGNKKRRKRGFFSKVGQLIYESI